jgi:putative ATP-binding cassette transporter
MGGFNAECDWAHVLSLGEQQRIGFLRLLRRRPAVAFLDEATSGVDSKTETALYRALQSVCPCIVSVGHRKELLNHHTHVLEAVGDGQWKLQAAAEYRLQAL